MKKLLQFSIALLASISINLNAQIIKHHIKITLDTKLMSSLDYSLNGGSGTPSPLDKVYAHLGLCTCNLHLSGTTFTRVCSNPDSNYVFCYSQIRPYRSNVWEHVVGNWGENPADDGVGLMTTLGNGVYSIEFDIEDYFSDPSKVNTTSFIDPNETTPVVSSSVWNPSDGGSPQTIGMVFRNVDGTITGRDDNGKDLFITGLTSSTPQVIQGYDAYAPFPAVTFLTGIGEVDNTVHYLSVDPNPVKDYCQIIYTLTKHYDNVSLKIVDAFGKEVAILINGKQDSGSKMIMWDGTNTKGDRLANGVYYCELKAGFKVFGNKKIVLVR